MVLRDGWLGRGYKLEGSGSVEGGEMTPKSNRRLQEGYNLKRRKVLVL